MVSVVVSFVLSFFPRDVLDEILNLIESVSEDFPSYFCHLSDAMRVDKFDSSCLQRSQVVKVSKS